MRFGFFAAYLTHTNSWNCRQARVTLVNLSANTCTFFPVDTVTNTTKQQVSTF